MGIAFVDILYWKSLTGNFGDDMNQWFWRRVVADAAFENHEIAILGIGSLLGGVIEGELAKIPEKKKVVLGSGFDYIRTPNSILNRDSRWDIRFVRGPITAQHIGCEPEKAICDPAIVVSEIMKPNELLEGEQHSIFVPHWQTAQNGHWKRAVDLTSIEYVDPRADFLHVLARIASSKLVLAESLHAAIIADSFRVPWVPIKTGGHIAGTKWNDWAQSLGVQFEQTEILDLVELPTTESIGTSSWLRHGKSLLRSIVPDGARQRARSLIGAGARALSEGGQFERAAKSIEAVAEGDGFMSEEGACSLAKERVFEQFDAFNRRYA